MSRPGPDAFVMAIREGFNTAGTLAARFEMPYSSVTGRLRRLRRDGKIIAARPANGADPATYRAPAAPIEVVA